AGVQSASACGRQFPCFRRAGCQVSHINHDDSIERLQPAVMLMIAALSFEGFASSPYFFGVFASSGTGSRIMVTIVSSGGMRSVCASYASSALSLELLIGRSSRAPSKFDTQITSPALAA